MPLVKYFFIIQILFLYSCGHSKEKSYEDKVKSIVEKIRQDRIILPDTMNILQGKKSILFQQFYSRDTVFKIVTNIRGDCYKCIAEIESWQNEFINHVDTSYVKFYFYVTTIDYFNFLNNLYPAFALNYPIIIDHNDTYLTSNNLIDLNEEFHTFLLDKSNNVVLIGNPLHYSDLKQFYFEEINSACHSFK